VRRAAWLVSWLARGIALLSVLDAIESISRPAMFWVLATAELKTMSGAWAVLGATLPTQLLASAQLAVPAPPSQMNVAGTSRASRLSSANERRVRWQNPPLFRPDPQGSQPGTAV